MTSTLPSNDITITRPTRRAALRMGAACALGALGANAARAQASTRIEVGYVSAADWLPAMVAKDKGLFEKRKLDVTLTKIALISHVPAALLAGSLQIGVSTPPALIDATEAGLDLQGFAGSTRFVKDPAIFSLVVRDGLQIQSPKDFEGKKIGVPGLRSSGDVTLRRWLALKNVDVAKVSIVETAFPQMKDVLKSKTVDAVVALEPIRSRILSDNTGWRYSDYMVEVHPDLLGSVWIAQRSWIQANTAAVRSFREALGEGIEFIQKNPDEAGTIEAKYLGFNTPIRLPYSLALSTDDLDNYVKLQREVGYLKKPVDTGRLIFR